jgi:hypothetical protein
MERVLLRIAICIIVTLTAIHQVNSTAFQLFTQVNEYKQSFIGTHEAISKVIWSSDQSLVGEGGKSNSIIKFAKVGDSIFPSWESANWVTVRNKVIEFKNNYLKWEIETKTQEKNKYVFVRSVLQVTFPSDGLPIIKGFHILYHDGEQVCSYITKSYLYPKK